MFSIDLTSRIPIYEQIREKIIELIVQGTLHENDQLPSVRSLAKDTGVNPNTVSKAYQELERQGIIYSVPGRGSFIAKQDSEVYRRSAIKEFDSAVKGAFSKGVSSSELKERIDIIESDYRKGNDS